MGFRVQGLGFRASGLRLRVLGVGLSGYFIQHLRVECWKYAPGRRVRMIAMPNMKDSGACEDDTVYTLNPKPETPNPTQESCKQIKDPPTPFQTSMYSNSLWFRPPLFEDTDFMAQGGLGFRFQGLG